LVTEYLDALTHELRFDRQLSWRVRQEIEDHLLQAIADEPSCGSSGSSSADPSEAQRRAIARLGDPREIARQYAPLSLLRQARRVGAIMIVALAAILALMKGRGALYGILQWRLNDDWLGISTIGPAIDRYTFQVALAVGVLGWVYISSRRVSPTLNSGYRKQLKCCLLLSLVAAGLLIGSVVMDAVLSGLRFVGVGFSLPALIPLLSMAFELALVGVIAVQLRNSIQRATLVATLFSQTPPAV
jgi:hypothetical protein